MITKAGKFSTSIFQIAHPQLWVFEHVHGLIALLRHLGRDPADGAKVEAAMSGTGLTHLWAALPLASITIEPPNA